MSAVKTIAGDRIAPHERPPRRFVAPYMISLAAHACILILLGTTMRGCYQGPAGFGDVSGREVGFYAERFGNGIDTQAGDGSQLAGHDSDPQGTEIHSEPAAPVNQFAPTSATSDKPPAEILLPTADSPGQAGNNGQVAMGGQVGTGSAIGTTVSFPSGSGGDGSSGTMKSKGGTYNGTGTSGGKPGGIPGAAFMGARDQGMKVVFVIDASGSMTSNNAMQVAKGALMSSLQALDERQQFLIIFYDDKPHVIKLHEEAVPTMTVANDLNKTLARQKISGIQPGSGTDHLPPLEMALRLKPEVIFFLTDALEPPLWPKDLDRIKMLNGGKTRIHSIEFGQGPELMVDSNFLRTLANQNGGSYRYHDVTRFKAP